ncbi:MAG: GNAT family N-acetyltransferase [Oscillospiraceae bacterium]|nr:GNAT family N-acetyltransferase [Oscillospiraceae bacterium]
MNKILTASYEDKQEILELYRTMLYGPADWNEYYPNEDTIEFDLSRNALYVMKNDEGQIISAISIDEDEAVDSLDCWDRALFPGAEISRLCVRKDMQHQGIAKQMMRYVFEVLKKQCKKSVHILVKTGHTAAISSYGAIGFKTVGNCRLFDKDFVCMEKSLDDNDNK